MTVLGLIDKIRREHEECCVVTNCRDRNCSLDLRGLDGDSMVIINGSMYQKAHNPAGKLCDRIILSGEQGGFVCAVELKGGRSQPSIPPIVEQIQAGIVLADELLNGISPRGCYPILAFSGRMIPIASTAFKSKNNRVAFLGNYHKKRLRLPDLVVAQNWLRC